MIVVVVVIVMIVVVIVVMIFMMIFMMIFVMVIFIVIAWINEIVNSLIPHGSTTISVAILFCSVCCCLVARYDIIHNQRVCLSGNGTIVINITAHNIDRGHHSIPVSVFQVSIVRVCNVVSVFYTQITILQPLTMIIVSEVIRS